MTSVQPRHIWGWKASSHSTFDACLKQFPLRANWITRSCAWLFGGCWRFSTAIDRLQDAHIFSNNIQYPRNDNNNCWIKQNAKLNSIKQYSHNMAKPWSKRKYKTDIQNHLQIGHTFNRNVPLNPLYVNHVVWNNQSNKYWLNVKSSKTPKTNSTNKE